MLTASETGTNGLARTVLIVDDQPEVRELYRLNLEFAGYRVAEAGDGRAALDTVAAGNVPDCVLLDLMLPGIDGWEVLTALRRQLAARVPVLVVSARAGRDDLERVLDAGADAYLVKPFPPRSLVDAVHGLFAAAESSVIVDGVASAVAAPPGQRDSGPGSGPQARSMPFG